VKRQQVSLLGLAREGVDPGIAPYVAAVPPEATELVEEVAQAVSDQQVLLTDPGRAFDGDERQMAWQARKAGGYGAPTVIADRGYFSGEEIRACERAGMISLVLKPLTSGKAGGRFGKQGSSVEGSVKKGLTPHPGTYE
jgi:hypothetical protein